MSLRVSDDGTRILFNSFAGDEPRVVFAYLGIDDAEAGPKPSRAEVAAAIRRREEEAAKVEREKLAFCAEVWEGTLDLKDSIAARYLWNRGLVLDDCSDIRFHPAAPRRAPWNEHHDSRPLEPHPALICLARNGRADPRGIHATYITEDGKKAFGDRSRLMYGPMSGAALRTAPVTPDGRLAVGEGLETAGAFSILRSVPTWPTFSTSGLKKFEIPPGVRRLLIAADNDENGKGLEAAEELAERARSRCEVEIHMPEITGDWNTVLMGEAA